LSGAALVIDQRGNPAGCEFRGEGHVWRASLRTRPVYNDDGRMGPRLVG
jgi:hypothetical protein